MQAQKPKVQFLSIRKVDQSKVLTINEGNQRRLSQIKDSIKRSSNASNADPVRHTPNTQSSSVGDYGLNSNIFSIQTPTNAIQKNVEFPIYQQKSAIVNLFASKKNQLIKGSREPRLKQNLNLGLQEPYQISKSKNQQITFKQQDLIQMLGLFQEGLLSPFLQKIKGHCQKSKNLQQRLSNVILKIVRQEKKYQNIKNTFFSNENKQFQVDSRFYYFQQVHHIIRRVLENLTKSLDISFKTQKNDRNDLNANLKAIFLEVISVKSKQKYYQSQCKTLQQKIKTQSAQGYPQKIKELKSRINALQEEKIQLNSMISKFKDNQKQFQIKIRQKDQQYEQQMRQNNQSLKYLQKSNGKLNQQIRLLQSQFQSSNNKFNNRIQQLSRAKYQLEQQVQKLIQQIQKIQKTNKENKKINKQVIEQKESNQIRQLRQLNSQNKRLSQLIHQLSLQLEQANQRINNYEQTLNCIQEQQQSQSQEDAKSEESRIKQQRTMETQQKGKKKKTTKKAGKKSQSYLKPTETSRFKQSSTGSTGSKVKDKIKTIGTSNKNIAKQSANSKQRQSQLIQTIHNYKLQIQQLKLRQADVYFNGLLQSSNLIDDKDINFKKSLFKTIRSVQKLSNPRFKLLYQYDQTIKSNFHPYIDNKQSLLLLIKLQNGIILGGYSEQPLKKGVLQNRGFLFSFRNDKLHYYPLKSQQSASCMFYDDYFIIFGKSQISIRMGENKLYSNFGVPDCHFDADKDNYLNFLYGKQKGNQKNQRTILMKGYQCYQIVNSSN